MLVAKLYISAQATISGSVGFDIDFARETRPQAIRSNDHHLGVGIASLPEFAAPWLMRIYGSRRSVCKLGNIEIAILSHLI